MRLLVCGGAGFIGSNFVRARLSGGDDEIVVLDKLTYAGRRESLRDLERDPRFSFVHAAIEDPVAVAAAMDGVEAIVNFAAETHVDRSIVTPDAFVRTHALGTFVLLEAARERDVRFVQVSTDEVYGSIEQGSFTESSPLDPSSPYSATKAGADLLVSSYRHTYGTETLIARGSNNYGPYQYPEKLIPLMVLNALAGDRLPLYGDGGNVRNWLFVEDFAAAIGHVLEHGTPGETYNVGGPDECPNIDVVRAHPRAVRPRRVADRVCQRPPRPRPPLLAGLGQDPRARLGADDALRHRARADCAVVPRQRLVVGADPQRRLPRLLRAPVRPLARRFSALSARAGAARASNAQSAAIELIRQPAFSCASVTVEITLLPLYSV